MNKIRVFKLVFCTIFLTIVSCEREIDFILPSPAINALTEGSSEVVQEPGMIVYMEFLLEATSGLAEFKLTKDNEIFEQINFDGELTFYYQFEYVIPETAEIGTVMNFNIELSDRDNRTADYSFKIIVANTFFEDIISINGIEIVVLKGRLNGDYTFNSDNKYLIDSILSVENAGILQIEPGTKIFFKTFEEPNLLSRLVVAQNSKIFADGTAQEPIVFSSDKVLLNQTPSPDDWGGIFIHGNAPTNEGEIVILNGYRYGGNKPSDNSGVLRYVRIEYAGKNGNHALTFAGVGSQTEVEYVQIYRNENIACRLRGGRVSLKYFAAIGHGGYGIWGDYGWQGNGQFIICQTDVPATLVPVNFWNQARSIEMRNNPDNFKLEPRTQFKLSNVTLIGNGYIQGEQTGTRRGVRIRRGAFGILQNMLVTEFPNDAVRVEDLSIDELESGIMVLDNSRSFNNFANYAHEALTFFFESGNFNLSNASNSGVNLTNFVGSETSNFDPAGLHPFFSSAPFIGAVESEENDWTKNGNWFKDINGQIR